MAGSKPRAGSLLTSIHTINKTLQSLNLTGVERVGKDPLGNGAYGKVFAVNHGGKSTLPKKFTQYYLRGLVQKKNEQ